VGKLAETPHDLLENLHRCLFPERWKGCDPDLLNGEGVYEWTPDDLECIAYILDHAVDLGHIIPDLAP